MKRVQQDSQEPPSSALGQKEMPCTPPGRKSWEDRDTPSTPRTSTSTEGSEQLSPITPPDAYRSHRTPLFDKTNIPQSLALRPICSVDSPLSARPTAGDEVEGVKLFEGCNFVIVKKLGSGQWSNVHLAEIEQANASQGEEVSELSHTDRSYGLSSHPAHSDVDNHRLVSPSPSTKPVHPVEIPRTVAVKMPTSRMAKGILLDEARVHSRLMTLPLARRYIVEFYGYDLRTNGLLLGYIPMQLDTLAESRDLGVSSIQHISRQLVNGLDFLHSASVIHGDIKPSNILVRHNPSLNVYEPVYCDFSSSRLDRPDSQVSDSAGTYDYMAPELFSATRSPTKASDVYALAVTLIFTITGKGVYKDAQNLFTLRAMAMQGRPLDFASADLQASKRLGDSRLRTSIDRASTRKPEQRSTAREWMETFEGLSQADDFG